MDSTTAEIDALRARCAELELELNAAQDARDYAQMISDSLVDDNIHLVESLVLALDARDPYTAGHSLAVAVYARDIAESVSMPDCTVHRVYLAGLVHDIGKIAIPDAVLCKPGRLTDDEFRLIQTHPVAGERILRPAGAFGDLLPAVRHHHERIDGRGYPDQFRGAEIPAAARILAVADAYNAMTSTRSYRAAMPPEKAISILLEHAGEQHDGRLVQAFVEVLLQQGDAYATASADEFAVGGNLAEILAGYTLPQECMYRAA